MVGWLYARIHPLVPLVLALTACAAQAQRRWEPAALPSLAAIPTTTGARLPLHGTWTLHVDPGAVGLADGWAAALTAGLVPASAPGQPLPLTVPGAIEGHAQTVSYDGVSWLSHAFWVEPGEARPGARWELAFTRVNYQVLAWLDGAPLGEHAGSYEPFTLPVPALGPGRHVLVLRVLDPGAVLTDGLRLRTTPHAKESWYDNHGGVLGPVALQRLDATRAALTWLEVDPATGRVRAEVELAGPASRDPAANDVELVLTLSELAPGSPWPVPADVAAPRELGRTSTRVHLVDGGAHAALELTLPDAARWSPAAPRRHLATVRLAGQPAAPEGSRPFGFRSLSLGDDGLRIDGVRHRLHGVLWQPHFTGTGGLEPPAAELEAEAAAILGAGFNLVRAHVRPAPDAFLEAADRLGLLVLEEPAIGWVEDDEQLLPRLRDEVDTLVERHQHHPSIVLWGVLNELSGKAYRYGDELLAQLAARDGTRPILLDSGGFFGRGRYADAGSGGASAPMLDEHIYPPFPLPTEQRARLLTVAAESGPTFVSEFGYGSLVDAARTWEGFRARGLRDGEAALFAGQAAGWGRALAAGEGWTTAGWQDGSRELQAAALAEMIEALRANPAVDMLCLTQWRAVSSENSAGLLEPWGEARPSLAAVREALAPLRAVVVPARPSALAGETAEVDVVLINDGPEAWNGVISLKADGAVLADGGAGPAAVSPRSFGPGVTRVRLPLLRYPTPGVVALQAVLSSAEGVTLGGRPVPVAVLPASAGASVLTRLAPDGQDAESIAVRVVDPVGERAVADFAERAGLELLTDYLAADAAAVVLLAHPERLGEDLDLEERLALWQHVDSGGAVLALLPDPLESEFGRLVAGARGRRHLVDLPVRVELAAGGGNFMGRVYPLLEAVTTGPPSQRMPAFALAAPGLPALAPRPVLHRGRVSAAPAAEVRLLAPGEGELTPVTMLTGELPLGTRPLMLAVGPLGNRLGAPVAAVPYGRGAIVFVGLPLLTPVAGAADARRDAFLAHLVLESAADAVWRLHGLGQQYVGRAPEPVEGVEGELLERAMDAVRRLVGAADRYSLVHAGSQVLPEAPAAALDGLHRALTDLSRGYKSKARQALLEAYTRTQEPDTEAFLALERSVLDDVALLRRSSAEADLLVAHEAVDCWQLGLTEWFTGSRETGLAWMGRAEKLLVESGRLP